MCALDKIGENNGSENKMYNSNQEPCLFKLLKLTMYHTIILKQFVKMSLLQIAQYTFQ